MNEHIDLHTSRRDVGIVLFLWEHKVATTAMLYQKFFSDIKQRTAYNVLLKLRKKKLIAVRTNDYGENPLWTLEKKGLNYVIGLLPELKTKAYLSENKEHDLFCTSILLGEFLKKIPDDIKITSEQRLRTFHPEFLHSSVYDPEVHRPDGYWHFENGSKIKSMALEVEINQKSKKRYRGYSYFYEEFAEDERCLWIVKSPKHAITIIKSMYEYQPEYQIHNFVLLKDIVENNWSCKIIRGPEKGQALSNLFYQRGHNIDSNGPVRLFTDFLKERRLTYQLYRKKGGK